MLSELPSRSLRAWWQSAKQLERSKPRGRRSAAVCLPRNERNIDVRQAKPSRKCISIHMICRPLTLIGLSNLG